MLSTGTAPANSAARVVAVAGTVMKNFPIARTVALLLGIGAQLSSGTFRTRLPFAPGLCAVLGAEKFTPVSALYGVDEPVGYPTDVWPPYKFDQEDVVNVV